MKRILVIVAAALALSACSTTEQSTGVGAVGGALIGAATTGTVVGTAIGAGVGATAGYVVGRIATDSPYCYYWNRQHTRKYRDYCPQGY